MSLRKLSFELSNAQLWMSCHNASLLDDLIEEEVYFCEKGSCGRTRVDGLQDSQDIRDIRDIQDL